MCVHVCANGCMCLRVREKRDRGRLRSNVEVLGIFNFSRLWQYVQPGLFVIIS